MKTTIITLILVTTFISCTQESQQKAKKLSRLKHMKSNSRKTNLELRLDNLQETTFRFPCGDEIGTGYYNAQGFQDNIRGDGDHLAWDINGVGGGNTDLGDTIYSIGNGIVSEVEEVDYLVVYYKYKGKTIKVLYYHMYKPMVEIGQIVTKGQPIALIGNSDGCYLAHLHLEIMTDISLGARFYGNPEGFMDPTKLFPNFENKKL